MAKQGYEEFLLSVPGSKTDIYDMNNIISPTGDWARLQGTAVIIRRIISQLMIPKGNYVFDPLFGENIYQYIFEPADNETQRKLTLTIQEVIDQNKGDVDITHEILWFKNKKGFLVNILIKTNGVVSTVPLEIDEHLLKDSN